MKLKQSFWYQFRTSLPSIGVYYIVIACVIALFAIGGTVLAKTAAAAAGGTGTAYLATGGLISLSFISAASVIFLFVCGLCTFKENFGMLSQNALSRKSVFWGRVCVAGVAAVCMALVDNILSLVFSLFFNFLFSGTGIAIAASTITSFPAWLFTFAYSLAAYFAFTLLGYAISILFYRLGPVGKVLVGAGVPVFFTILLPLLDEFVFRGAVSRVMDYLSAQYAALAQSFMPLHILAALLGGAVCALCAWLLMRKAIVRK